MSRTIEGFLDRFFYHPTEKYVHFMLREDPKTYKLFLSPSYMCDKTMLELSQPGDKIKVVASEPTLVEMDSTISSWENFRLAFIFTHGY